MLLEHFTLEAIAVAIAIAYKRQDRLIADLDPLLTLGEDREDAGFENIAARPFEQTGIALFAQDRLVNFARPLLLDDIGLNELVSDPHSETGDRCILRQWEVKDALENGIGSVDERLFDDGARDLIADIDRDMVIADRERHVAAIDGGHERAKRLVGRAPLEALQPDRLLLYANEF